MKRQRSKEATAIKKGKRLYKKMVIHFAVPEEYSESELDIAIADSIADSGGECIEIEDHLDDDLYSDEDFIDKM